MGTQPDELRSEVEHTRAHLARNVDLLADRMAPRRIARRKADSAQHRLRGIKEHVMGSAKDTRSGLSSTAHSAADTAGEGAEQVGEKAKVTAGMARDTAGRLGNKAQHTPARMKERTQGSPLAAGVMAFGAGMVAAAFLPSSKAEERVGEQLREHSGELLEPLKQSARDVQEGLRDPADEAVEAVKSAAQDAARATKDETRSAGQDTAQGLREAGKDDTRRREP
ncbi:DUF3618 domain-containing protein [Streptomyces xantholiticus]|uniref:DUF3618 domain-containing protein n=1 Tax=Streptomyces xantholiticus TaxID=68285 RepID=UPI00167B2759|nr:DUF3618 domain-containing protein [Streptomyces xantholiticus]GGW39113.1 hypothetical protein GCM10010381_24720 [Streptomyces xantholiticus]